LYWVSKWEIVRKREFKKSGAASSFNLNIDVVVFFAYNSS
jgi:hypothetical protein